MSDLKTRLKELDLDALSDRELLVVVLVGLVLLAGLLWIGFSLLDPPPPRALVISAGRRGGGYFAAGQRYRELFARNGITLEVRESSGSVENLERLLDPRSGVNIALVQSGTFSSENGAVPSVESLASLYYEPVLVFHHLPGPVTRLSQLRGKRIAVGDPGSGTLATAEQLLLANGVDRENAALRTVSSDEGIRLLERGELDAVFVIAQAESPVVQEAFKAGLPMVDFEQSDAYVRRFPWLSKLTLPRGSVNLGTDYPPSDVHLLAPTANLLVRADLNPALAYLLLEIAAEVHAQPGLFQRAGEFPAPAAPGFSASAQAQRYFQSGKPLFQRYLPFWVANRLERTLVVIIPFLVVLVPALRIGPALLRWRKKARVNRLYGELKEIEARFPEPLAAHLVGPFASALSALEKRAQALRLPLQYGSDQYQLRAHIALLRQRLSPNGTAAASSVGTQPGS
jgi:TRAP transporter TAXI family solute receptor